MMKHTGLFCTGVAAASVAGFAEVSLRLRDKANAQSRYLRERWTLARPWERFDLRSGWELRAGYLSDDVRINSQGFRGQELRDGDARRVLCLGGSVTFGPPGEETTYPRLLTEALNAANPDDPVEVINAGVTGHSTYNMLFRSAIWDAVTPDVTVIMAGDDDLFRENITRYPDNRQPYTSFWHVDPQRTVYCHLWSLIRETAGMGGRKPLSLAYDPAEFVPFNFAYNLGKILDIARRKGSIPILVTIPTLIPDDLSDICEYGWIGTGLPAFLADGDTEGFLSLWHSYNTVIRALAEEQDVPLIDAARHFGEMGTARCPLFSDLFQLTVEGNRVLGTEIARGLRERGLV